MIVGDVTVQRTAAIDHVNGTAADGDFVLVNGAILRVAAPDGSHHCTAIDVDFVIAGGAVTHVAGIAAIDTIGSGANVDGDFVAGDIFVIGIAAIDAGHSATDIADSGGVAAGISVISVAAIDILQGAAGDGDVVVGDGAGEARVAAPDIAKNAAAAEGDMVSSDGYGVDVG